VIARLEASGSGPLPTQDLVVRALREAGNLTRAELARSVGVSPATVTSVVGRLVTEGVLVESDDDPALEPPRPGRRGRGLTLNPACGAVLGIDFGFRHVRVLVCDLAHRVAASRELPLEESHASGEALAVTSHLIDTALEGSGFHREDILGAGIALPGPVLHQASDSVGLSSILPGWANVTNKVIEETLGFPVRLDNDANLAALGERKWGAVQNVDDCIVIKFHSGIGCGLIVNGTLVRGAQGGAGEIGHVTIDERGPLCRCGKRGCLDSFASIPAILNTMSLQHGQLTLRALMSLLNNGDSGAMRVVSDAAELVGKTVADACNLLAPQRIVVVGAMTEAGDLLLGPIRAALKRYVAPIQPPEVVLGSLGKQHTALGAAALALEDHDWIPLRKRPTAAASGNA